VTAISTSFSLWRLVQGLLQCCAAYGMRQLAGLAHITWSCDCIMLLLTLGNLWNAY
jgi:hypothetical protein